jgi:hypothetical protein
MLADLMVFVPKDALKRLPIIGTIGINLQRFEQLVQLGKQHI